MPGEAKTILLYEPGAEEGSRQDVLARRLPTLDGKVVGLLDNLVKPMLVRGRTTLPGGVVFFAMVCGLALFGLTGIVAGPLIVTFFMAVARLASQPTPAPAVSA